MLKAIAALLQILGLFAKSADRKQQQSDGAAIQQGKSYAQEHNRVTNAADAAKPEKLPDTGSDEFNRDNRK